MANFSEMATCKKQTKLLNFFAKGQSNPDVDLDRVSVSELCRSILNEVIDNATTIAKPPKRYQAELLFCVSCFTVDIHLNYY